MIVMWCIDSNDSATKYQCGDTIFYGDVTICEIQWYYTPMITVLWYVMPVSWQCYDMCCQCHDSAMMCDASVNSCYNCVMTFDDSV